MKRFLLIWVLLFSVLQVAKSETEPNDMAAQANLLTIDNAQSGVLSGTDVDDWFILTLTQGGIVSFTVHKTGFGNARMYLLDGDKTGFPEISNLYLGYSESPGEGWTLSYPLLPGRYYIHFLRYDPSVSYTLTPTLILSAYGQDNEPNHVAADAQVFVTGGSVGGTLHYYRPNDGADVTDWFKMVVPKGGILSLKIHKKGPGNTWIRLRDAEMANYPEISNFYTGYSESPNEGWTWTFPALAGTYLFQVSEGEYWLDYKMEASLIAPAYPEDTEPNQSFDQASLFPVNGTVSGALRYYAPGEGWDLKDWYKMTIPKGGVLNIRVHKRGTGNAWIRLRDAQSVNIPEISNFYTGYSPSPDEGWNWSFPVLAGNYFFQVEDGENVVDYKMEATLALPAWGEDQEVNDSLFLAQKFTVNDSVGGLIGYYRPGFGYDVWDWYKMDVPEKGLITFKIIKHGNENGNFRFRNETTELGTSYLGFGDQNNTFSKLIPAGKYYFGTEKYGGDYQYKIISALIPVPVAHFGYAQTGNVIAFENTTLHQATYLWNFDDGSTAEAINPLHEFKNPGVFDVCLEAKNEGGRDTFCRQIVVEGINQVLPNRAGNTGDVTLRITGGGMDTFFNVHLVQNGQTIITSTYTGFGGKATIVALLDLHGAPVGTYDLVVEKPGGASYTLPNGFTVIQGIEANPWVTVNGRDRILFNTWTTYNITYGNNGNVDAMGVPLWIVISNAPGVQIDMSAINVVLPDEAYEWGLQKIAQDMLPYTFVDSLFGEPFNGRVYAYMIPYISPGVTKSFPIKIKTNQDIEVMAWVNPPYYRSPFISDIWECAKKELLTSAIKDGIFSQVKELFGAQTECLLSILDKVNSLRGEATREDRKIDGTTFGVWVYGYGLTLIKCGLAYAPGTGLAATFFSQLAKTQKRLAQAAKILDCARLKDNQRRTIKAVSSLDPNEKTGLAGFGDDNFVLYHKTLPYTIQFENKASATAPAHTVYITDTLDKTIFDLSTFSFGDIIFGNQIISPQRGLKSFVADEKTQNNLVTARVLAQLDLNTGIVQWVFRSLDPVSLEDIEDPDLGFLPPNKTNPEGQGSVSFTIQVKGEPVHEAQIFNLASIVFDANEPIVTNDHLLTFDLRAPESRITPLPATTHQEKVTISWSGTDSGSGLQSYDIYLSTPDVKDSLWIAHTTALSAEFKGEVGSTYSFYSVATDNAGNVEFKPVEADAEISFLVATDELATDASLTIYPNPARDVLYIVATADLSGLFTLTNLQGTDTRQIRILGSGKNQLPVRDVPAGLYFWTLKNQDGKIWSGKIVIAP